MPPLLVIPAMPRTAAAGRAQLPVLPALTELLRRSDALDPDPDWRSGVLRDLGVAHPAIPAGVIAAAAIGLPADVGVCIASPVHAVAGLHRVHLHDVGILPLAEAERSEIAAGFAAQFGPAQRLHAAGNQWLLEGACAIAAQDTDPLEWIGAPLERQPAGSAEQRALRRMGAEVEMWFADLPVNTRRRSRGQLPVNLLWMWGGGAMPAADQLPTLPVMPVHGAADDAWLAGCAHLAGGVVSPLPAAWAGIAAVRSLVVLPAADVAELQTLEATWFAPALEAVRAGRIPGFDLRLGRRRHRVRAGRWRRLLRRSRPWWQVVDVDA